jgi:hypothetical protein
MVEEWRKESKRMFSAESVWTRHVSEYQVHKESKGMLFLRDSSSLVNVRVDQELISDQLFKEISSTFEPVLDKEGSDLNLSLGVNFAVKNSNFGIQIDNEKAPRTIGFKRIAREIPQNIPVFAAGVLRKRSDGNYYLEPENNNNNNNRKNFCLALGDGSEYFENEAKSLNSLSKVGMLSVGMGILTAAGTAMAHLLFFRKEN